MVTTTQSATDIDASSGQGEERVTRVFWLYIALAFGFSWTAWMVAIKLHAREAFLNIGAAGPAFAAMLLSRRYVIARGNRLRRWLVFLAVLIACWAVLSLRYSSTQNVLVGAALSPWLLIVSICPAWVISGAFSNDAGVRNLMQRLVGRFTWWSVAALLFFPAILLLPALLARVLHQPLAVPQQGTAAQMVSGALVLFLFNVLFVAVLEEPGWRGFLLDHLQLKCSPLLASLAVWLPWAAWHAPLDYSRPVRFTLITYLQVRVVFLIPIVVILTWLYNRSGRSIQATAIFHASMNTFPFVLPYFAPGLALLFLLAAWAIVADRMWRKPQSRTAPVPLLSNSATSMPA